MKIVTKKFNISKERNIVTKSFSLFQHFKSIPVLSKLLKMHFSIQYLRKTALSMF